MVRWAASMILRHHSSGDCSAPPSGKQLQLDRREIPST